MNNQEKNKFLGMLYDNLISAGIIKHEDKPRDLKEKKLQKYLNKLEKYQKKEQELGIDSRLKRIKELYYDKYIIKEENIPDKYFESLQQQYLEQGYGYINLVNPQTEKDKAKREEHIATIIKEQKETLDNWLDYFFSEDSSYLEMWAKVWAFQGMLHIGNLNKGKDGYERRGKATVNPFVSFDSEILGKCVELVKETFDKKELTDEEVKKLVSSGSFPKIYGMMLANKKQIKAETTEGVWIKYNRETNQSIESKLSSGQEPEYIKLYNSLQGYNTGWCTAGAKETAKNQILGGDFYVYYSKDKEEKFTIPRLAIRMEGSSIGEIRGIAPNQNIESNMEEILEEKLREFPDRDKYKKKVSDMKTLTIIYNKHLKGEELTKEDLIFVYEIYNKIEGFGYDDDPRIDKILAKRNKKKDLACVLDCSEEEIGLTKEDFNSGRRLKYYEGGLDLSELTSAEGLVLPQILNGGLNLSGLTSAEGLVLPQTINGGLNLGGLTSAEGLVLPQTINGNLYLSGLTSVEGLVLPQTINGDLYLSGLTSAEGLVLPQTINGDLYLSGLTSAKELVLPQTINGGLYLNGLTSAEGLVLPKIINGDLKLRSLMSAEGLVLPQIINGDLNLKSLTSAEGLILPQTINGSLCLAGLKSAEGLVLPNIIDGGLHLNSLSSLVGIVLPSYVGIEIFIYGKFRKLEEVVAMQKKEEEQSKGNKPKKLKRVKQDGFISNTIIILNIILFGILSFILALLIIK